MSDTGRGIAAGDLGRVFEPFWQGEASRTRPEGAGLGLSVSRRLAQLLGGDLVVVSAPGKGSTFVLSLPSAPNEPSAPAVARATVSPTARGVVVTR